MLLSQHMVVGGVIGMAVGNPIVGFGLGFVSHFVLDALPHFDSLPLDKEHWDRIEKYKGWPKATWVIAIVDLIVTGIICFWLLSRIASPWLFIWGALGGALPDILNNVPFWKKAFRRTRFGGSFERMHRMYHFSLKENDYGKIFLGIVLQLVLTIGGICLVL